MTGQPHRMLGGRRGALLLLFAGWLMAGALGLRSVAGPLGLKKVAALRAEVARVQAESEELSAQLIELKRWIAAETERPEVQAYRVRDLLGYVRPDECVVHIPP